MLYELIILGQLMRFPAHGYLIARIINDMIGPYTRISNGRLYPLLAKLEKDGLIEPFMPDMQNAQGDRQLRSYQITDAGRERFRNLMTDTTFNPGEYRRIFLQKVALFAFLKPAERLRLIDHYIGYCQAHKQHLISEAADLAQQADTWVGWQSTWTQDSLTAMQHMQAQWQLELDWAQELREKAVSCV